MSRSEHYGIVGRSCKFPIQTTAIETLNIETLNKDVPNEKPAHFSPNRSIESAIMVANLSGNANAHLADVCAATAVAHQSDDPAF